MDVQTFKRKTGVDIGYGSQQPKTDKKGGIRMARPLLNISATTRAEVQRLILEKYEEALKEFIAE